MTNLSASLPVSGGLWQLKAEAFCVHCIPLRCTFEQEARTDPTLVRLLFSFGSNTYEVFKEIVRTHIRPPGQARPGQATPLVIVPRPSILRHSTPSMLYARSVVPAIHELFPPTLLSKRLDGFVVISSVTDFERGYC